MRLGDRFGRAVGTALLALAVLGAGSGGVPRMDPVVRVAQRDLFALAGWEALHFPAKWVRWPLDTLRLALLGPEGRARLVHTYFDLGEEEARHRRELEQRLALRGEPGVSPPEEAEKALRAVEARRARVRALVERAMEDALSDLLAQEGLALRLGPLTLVWPPVDARLAPPPRLLITSPRDRILIRDAILMQGDLPVDRREALEEAILRCCDLSALVEDLGGVATYPAFVSTLYGPLHAFRTLAHEWLHHYLFFFPLGQAYGTSPEMTTLNETVADLVGRELGDRLSVAFGYEPPPEPPPGGPPPEPDFFTRTMRETRQRVDALLADGKVEEAEAYMERQRRLLAEHGYYLRKLNQAYFAFHGNYAEGPASVSPIGWQVRALREHSASLADFLRRVRSVSSYSAFLALLEQEGIPTGPEGSR